MSERQPDNPSTRSAGQTEGDVKNVIDNKKLCHPKYACGELVESVETFTILTTSPNAVLSPLHDRMPVILPRAAIDAWLDPGLQDAAVLGRLFVPAPDAEWEAVAVGPFVNRPTLDAPVCAEPLAGDDARGGGTPGGQLDLL